MDSIFSGVRDAFSSVYDFVGNLLSSAPNERGDVGTTGPAQYDSSSKVLLRPALGPTEERDKTIKAQLMQIEAHSQRIKTTRVVVEKRLASIFEQLETTANEIKLRRQQKENLMVAAEELKRSGKSSLPDFVKKNAKGQRQGSGYETEGGTLHDQLTLHNIPRVIAQLSREEVELTSQFRVLLRHKNTIEKQAKFLHNADTMLTESQDNIMFQSMNKEVVDLIDGLNKITSSGSSNTLKVADVERVVDARSSLQEDVEEISRVLSYTGKHIDDSEIDAELSDWWSGVSSPQMDYEFLDNRLQQPAVAKQRERVATADPRAQRIKRDAFFEY